MPIHGLVTPTTPVHVGFIQRLRLQATEHILKAGWNFERSKFLGLAEMSESDARRMIANARARGWLAQADRC
jgi:hypothetical protein